MVHTIAMEEMVVSRKSCQTHVIQYWSLAVHSSVTCFVGYGGGPSGPGGYNGGNRGYNQGYNQGGGGGYGGNGYDSNGYGKCLHFIC